MGKVTSAHVMKWRWVYFIASVFQGLACVGAFYGWDSLRSVLIDDGFCPVLTGLTTNYTKACDLALAEIFRYASLATFIAPFLSGIFLQKFGLKWTTRVLSSIFLVGSIFLYLAAKQKNGDFLYPALICIAISASANIIPLFPFSQYFLKNQGIVLTVLNGSFDAGSSVLLFWNLLYKGGNGWTLETISLAYLCGPTVVLVLLALFLWPDFIPPLEPTVASSDATVAPETPLENSKVSIPRKASLFGSTFEKSNYEVPILRQLLSIQFILYLCFFMMLILRFNYFIASASSLMDSLGQEDGFYSRIFGYCLAFGPLISSPLLGFVFDKISTFSSLILMVSFGLIVCVLAIIPELEAIVAAIPVFVFFRTSLFSVTAIYVGKYFGYGHMGTLIGVLNLFSGCLSLAQTNLIDWAYRNGTLEPEIPDFFWPNLFLLILFAVMSLVPFILAIMNFRALKKEEAKESEKEAEKRSQSSSIEMVSQSPT